MASIAFIHKAGGSVVVFVNGKPYTVEASSLNYKAVLKAINDADYHKLITLLDIRKTIADYTNGLVEVFGSDLFYDKKLMKGALAERIVYMLKLGLVIDPYIKFMEKLERNPLASSREELFLFMESNNLPITPDGDFLAYKAVDKSYKDHRTGNFSNHVGAVVEEPRELVNPDRTVTCSTGLHVCAYEYLGHYYNMTNSRLVVCKINPEDVVSVPNDYNNAKMRVCRYVVVDEIFDFSDNLDKNYTEEYSEFYDDEELDETEDLEEFDDYIQKLKEREVPSVSGKLTEDEVREIRNLLADEWTLAGIAKQYSISPRQVARIRDGEAWQHVK